MSWRQIAGRLRHSVRMCKGRRVCQESQEKREWERRPRKCPDKNGDKWELERIKRGWMEKVSIRNKRYRLIKRKRYRH